MRWDEKQMLMINYWYKLLICIMVHLSWRSGTLDWMVRDEGLDGYIRIPTSGKYIKFLMFIEALIKSCFFQKIFCFTLSSKYFTLYFFVYTSLLILVYLHFSFPYDSQIQQINLAKVYRAFASNSFFTTKKQLKSRQVMH